MGPVLLVIACGFVGFWGAVLGVLATALFAINREESAGRAGAKRKLKVFDPTTGPVVQFMPANTPARRAAGRGRA